MPLLIERGYVYIGLPPLYKLKQGKQELYLKDDAALNAYLIANAVEDAELRYSTDAPPLQGRRSRRLLHDYDARANRSTSSASAAIAVADDACSTWRRRAELWQDPARVARWIEHRCAHQAQRASAARTIRSACVRSRRRSTRRR
jgi:DNA gyrase subunit B